MIFNPQQLLMRDKDFFLKINIFCGNITSPPAAALFRTVVRGLVIQNVAGPFDLKNKNKNLNLKKKHDKKFVFQYL